MVLGGGICTGNGGTSILHQLLVQIAGAPVSGSVSGPKMCDRGATLPVWHALEPTRGTHSSPEAGVCEADMCNGNTQSASLITRYNIS
jgi:hypothetical protein